MPAIEAAAIAPGTIVALHGGGRAVARWGASLAAAGVRFEADTSSRWNGLQTSGGELRLTDGRPAAQVAAEEGVREMAVFDVAAALGGGAPGTALAVRRLGRRVGGLA